jgi:hypothetical protein
MHAALVLLRDQVNVYRQLPLVNLPILLSAIYSIFCNYSFILSWACLFLLSLLRWCCLDRRGECIQCTSRISAPAAPIVSGLLDQKATDKNVDTSGSNNFAHAIFSLHEANAPTSPFEDLLLPFFFWNSHVCFGNINPQSYFFGQTTISGAHVGSNEMKGPFCIYMIKLTNTSHLFFNRTAAETLVVHWIRSRGCKWWHWQH